MLRRGVSAGFVLILGAGALAVAATRSDAAPIAHTCSAPDKQFIRTASVNLTTVGLLGREYIEGEAEAEEVVTVAKRAARSVEQAKPTDPSLERTRLLMNGMFVEYGRAIDAQSRNRDAGRHMYRSYGLANFAHDVLRNAQPELGKRGCDIEPLL